MKPLLYYTGLFALLLLTGCRKFTYNTIGSPAYFRFFNSLNYTITAATKDQPQPYLTMVVDPIFDATGIVTGGTVVGDFLDKRLPYAPPYPANAGNTSVDNYEYPGSQKVLSGPILNGFDLSSWAQIASGKHRFAFFSRPLSTTPFFQLVSNERTSVFADTTVDLAEGEVYTMELLQRDVTSSPVKIDFYMRQEQFTKLPFDDSLCYLNFYNLSATGFTASQVALQEQNNGGGFAGSVQDTMNVYMSLHYPDSASYPQNTIVPGYQYIPMTSVVRSHGSGVAPYISFPVFPQYPGNDSTYIRSRIWEEFTLLAPDYIPVLQPFPSYYDQLGDYAALACTSGYYENDAPNNDAYLSPNLIITIPSGTYGNRSFPTISSFEVINNKGYVMSVQRQYAPPVESF